MQDAPSGSMKGNRIPSLTASSFSSSMLSSHPPNRKEFASVKRLPPSIDGDMLFEDFADILQRISLIPPTSVKSRTITNETKHRTKTLELITYLFQCLGPLSLSNSDQASDAPNSSRVISQSRILFRLLFPHLDIRRRYDVQEDRLGSLLSGILGLDLARTSSSRCIDTARESSSIASLNMRGSYSRHRCSSSMMPGRSTGEPRRWDDSTYHPWRQEEGEEEKGSSGCLGRVIEKFCLARHEGRRSALTIAQVDTLLDELAAASQWSDPSIRDRYEFPNRRSAASIITLLLRDLSPFASNLITQIILKDITPALHPPPSRSLAGLLLEYDQMSRYLMDRWDVMSCWEEAVGLQGRGMKSVWKTRTGFDSALDAVQKMMEEGENIGIQTGIAIEIPKCSKSRSLKSSLQLFQKRKTRVVWAETKYDGERMQIHVNLSLPPGQQIKIISKSGRDSTKDRIQTHQYILGALSQPIPPSLPQNVHLLSRIAAIPDRSSKVIQNEIILDAEMVPYSERKAKIEEFWKITDCEGDRRYAFKKKDRRSLSSSYRGPLLSTAPKLPSSNLSVQELDVIRHNNDIPDEDEISSQEVNRGDLHLMLVFFDCQMVDGISLIHQPYEKRRAVLESFVKVIDGFVMLAQRTMVDLTRSLDLAENTLKQCFLKTIANHEEGLVLKGEGTTYIRSPGWVKVKRDYIPGLQDTLDMVVLGASWNKQRGRELNVPSHVFTTFYVGVRDQAKNEQLTQPRYKILFPISYGLTRNQLEHWNNWIRSTAQGSSMYYKLDSKESKCPKDLPYLFDCANTAAKPQIIFKAPLIGEVFGAGFQKLAGSKYFEIRWPRLAKIYPPNNRYGGAGKTLSDIVTIDDYHHDALLQLGRVKPIPLSTREGTLEESFDVDACFRNVIDLPVPVNSVREFDVNKWATKLMEVDNQGEEIDEEGMESEPPEFCAQEPDIQVPEILNRSDVGLNPPYFDQTGVFSAGSPLLVSSSSARSASDTRSSLCTNNLKFLIPDSPADHLSYEITHGISPISSTSFPPSTGTGAIDPPSFQSSSIDSPPSKRKKANSPSEKYSQAIMTMSAAKLSPSVSKHNRTDRIRRCVSSPSPNLPSRDLLSYTTPKYKDAFWSTTCVAAPRPVSTRPRSDQPPSFTPLASIYRGGDIPLPALPHDLPELLSVANVFVVPHHDVPLTTSAHVPRDNDLRWINTLDTPSQSSCKDMVAPLGLPSVLLGSNRNQTETLEALLVRAGWSSSSTVSFNSPQLQPLQARPSVHPVNDLKNSDSLSAQRLDEAVFSTEYRHGIIILNINLPSRGQADLVHLRHALETRRRNLQKLMGNNSFDAIGKIMVLDAGVLDPGFRRLKHQDWRKMLLWASWPQL